MASDPKNDLLSNIVKLYYQKRGVYEVKKLASIITAVALTVTMGTGAALASPVNTEGTESVSPERTVVKLVIVKDTSTIQVGDLLAVDINAYYSDGDWSTVSEEADVESNNPSVADWFVDNGFGYVEGNSPGQAKFTVRYGGITRTFTVYVEE